MRLSDFESWLKSHGVAVEEPTKGSHFKATKAGFPMYPLPAHNGRRSELSDVYIRKCCKHFKLSSCPV
jgi:hypothetical protein